MDPDAYAVWLKARHARWTFSASRAPARAPAPPRAPPPARAGAAPAPPSPAGLVNPGAQCYANAALSLLLHVMAAHGTPLHAALRDGAPAGGVLWGALRDLDVRLRAGGAPARLPAPLIAWRGGGGFGVNYPHDAAEYLMDLLDRLQVRARAPARARAHTRPRCAQAETPLRHGADPIAETLGTSWVSTLTCSRCGGGSRTARDVICTPVSLNGARAGSALQLLDLLCTVCETDADYACAACGTRAVQHKVETCGPPAPPVLLFHIHRFHPGSHVRWDGDVGYPLTLRGPGDVQYELAGGVLHIAEIAHYVAFAACGAERTWRSFNDSDVRHIRPPQVGPAPGSVSLVAYTRARGV